MQSHKSDRMCYELRLGCSATALISARISGGRSHEQLRGFQPKRQPARADSRQSTHSSAASRWGCRGQIGTWVWAQRQGVLLEWTRSPRPTVIQTKWGWACDASRARYWAMAPCICSACATICPSAQVVHCMRSVVVRWNACSSPISWLEQTKHAHLHVALRHIKWHRLFDSYDTVDENCLLQFVGAGTGRWLVCSIMAGILSEAWGTPPVGGRAHPSPLIEMPHSDAAAPAAPPNPYARHPVGARDRSQPGTKWCLWEVRIV